MTREEFKIVVAALKSNYRNFGIESKAQFDFWYSMLSDIEYPVIQTAVKKLVSESTFSPTIADIRRTVAEITQPNMPDAANAWGQVTKAISQYGMYRAKEALESMDPLTRKVVSAMNFNELCLSENHMADRAHFIKIFNQLIEREKKNNVLSMPLKQDIKQLQDNRAKLNESIQMLTDKMSFQIIEGGKAMEG